MARSEQTKYEAESIIRWSEAENLTLWTASPATRKEWESFGAILRADATGRAWSGTAPLSWLSYKVMKK